MQLLTLNIAAVQKKMAALSQYLVPETKEENQPVLDITSERRNCSFNKEEITNIMDGSPEKTSLRRKVGKIYLLLLWGCVWEKKRMYIYSERFFMKTSLFAEKIFFSDPEFLDPLPPDYMSHEDRYANELRKACHMVKKLSQDEYLIGLAGSGNSRYTYICLLI